MKKKMIPFLIVIIFLLTVGTLAHISFGKNSSNKSSGGIISTSPAENISEAEQTCTSGGTCNGTCSNTWTDVTGTTCSKGTFTLTKKSPDSASTNYCVPSSAKGNGDITDSRQIVQTYGVPTATQVGTCTCVSGEYCDERETENVSVNLAQVITFGVSKK